MTATTKPRTRRKEPIGLRVRAFDDVHSAMCYIAATQSDADRLKPLHHREGDLVFADFRKPRVPGFHRLAHAIGKLAVENIDELAHLTPHEALKVLQVESGCGCERMAVDMTSIWRDVSAWIADNLGPAFAEVLKVALKSIGVKQRRISLVMPRSLSYDSLDQEEFHGVVKGICKYMALRYWPGMDPEEIERLAEAMQGDLDPGK